MKQRENHIEIANQYDKPEGVRELESLHWNATADSCPDGRPNCLRPRKFRDDTANGLAACIVEYIRLNGGFASRVNNTGIFDPRTRRFRKSNTSKGLPDILATYNGFSLFIEIKIGLDRQSTFQRQVQLGQEQAGGMYFIARSFTLFKEWFDNINHIST